MLEQKRSSYTARSTRLIFVWAEFKQSIIDKAIDQWRPRLTACELHFEQLINWNHCLPLSVERFCFYEDTFLCELRIFKGKHSHRSISICQKQLYFKFLQVIWRHNLGKVRKCLSYFVANLSTTPKSVKYCRSYDKNIWCVIIPHDIVCSLSAQLPYGK